MKNDKDYKPRSSYELKSITAELSLTIKSYYNLEFWDDELRQIIRDIANNLNDCNLRSIGSTIKCLEYPQDNEPIETRTALYSLSFYLIYDYEYFIDNISHHLISCEDSLKYFIDRGIAKYIDFRVLNEDMELTPRCSGDKYDNFNEHNLGALMYAMCDDCFNWYLEEEHK